ncbi:DUF5063 domain-containing protein [Bacteroidales bacterium OttesenSCG-928-I21]|nr:DUF5063 domain-containing protein [Bacteroidales bacterium OttesenSCG-928-I21]
MKDYTILYQKEAIEFVTVAKEYLSFMEESKNLSKDNFIDKSVKILPLLYLKGVLLPTICDFDEDYLEKFVDETTWSYIQQIASAKLDDDDEYTQIQDISIVSSIDSLNVGLSEIFADLYQEMGDIIGAYRIGNDESMLVALHYCQENFESYWGIRLLVLLKKLHDIKYINQNKD